MKAAADKEPPARHLRILLVEGQPLFRDGLARLLAAEPDMEVCGEAESAAQGLRAAGELQPDFAIVGLSFTGPSGMELLKDLRIRFPKLPVLVFSMHDENLYAERAVRAGARGYLEKRKSRETVLVAIRRIVGGDLYVSDRLASKLLHRLIEWGVFWTAVASVSAIPLSPAPGATGPSQRARPQNDPKAAWRLRFPPHSKALRAPHSCNLIV